MSRLLEKYQINIWMWDYSQIQGTRSKKDWELQDKSVPYFQQESGPCPLDWRITIHSTVDLVVFQQSWHTWFCWKIARTTFQCMFVPQSRGFFLLLLKFIEARISEWNIYMSFFSLDNQCILFLFPTTPGQSEIFRSYTHFTREILAANRAVQQHFYLDILYKYFFFTIICPSALCRSWNM